MAPEFHWGAMVLSAVAALVFGFLWYGPLFGKKWAAEMGMDPNMKGDMKDMMRPMFMQLVGAFLTAYALTWVIAGVGPEWDGFHMVLMPALIAWTGFYIPMHLAGVAWEEHSWELFSINSVHGFLNLLLIGSMVHYITF